MTKPINTIRDIIQQMNVTDPLKVSDVLLELLEKLADHESLINRMDGELAKITDAKRSVPAEWYHRAVHSHLKVYRELLALGEAVNEHESKCFVDASVFPGGLLVRDRQRQILAEDFEYQRLLAEEQPQIVIDSGSVDYTKPHAFDLAGDSGLKHTGYRVCKCGLSEGNALHV